MPPFSLIRNFPKVLTHLFQLFGNLRSYISACINYSEYPEAFYIYDTSLRESPIQLKRSFYLFG